MSHFLFIHDFFWDGYTDMLAEVRVLRECGQWTNERRALWTRRAVSEYEGVRHRYPRMDTGYWAGRLAAIKSNRTAPPKPRTETHGKSTFFSLSDRPAIWCLECCEKATWECYAYGLMTYLCDRCKQERVREQTAYSTPDGWDWDEHEDQLLPVPVPIGDKLVVKDRLESASIFFSCATTIGLVLLDMSFHIPSPMLLLQIVFVLHLTANGREILQGFRKCLKPER